MVMVIGTAVAQSKTSQKYQELTGHKMLVKIGIRLGLNLLMLVVRSILINRKKSNEKRIIG